VEDAGREGGAGEEGVDAGESFGNGALYWRRQGIGEGEGLITDGENEGAFGDAIVKPVTEAQEQRRCSGVENEENVSRNRD
jgi:hypothetical protein